MHRRRTPARVAALLAGAALVAGCAAGPAAPPPGPAAETSAPSSGSASPGSEPPRSASPDAGSADAGAVATLEPTDPREYAALVVEETNALRAAEGAGELATDACAEEAASARAAALVGAEDLEHAPLDDVIATCGPPGGAAAENLSRAAATPAAVVEAWDGSPGHRANLVDPDLTAVGVGCVLDDGRDPAEMLCAQVFLG